MIVIIIKINSAPTVSFSIINFFLFCLTAAVVVVVAVVVMTVMMLNLYVCLSNQK